MEICVLGQAEEARDLRAATSVIREARGCLELHGKVTGELALADRHAHLHAHFDAEKQPPPMPAIPPELEEEVRALAKKLVLHSPSPVPALDLVRIGKGRGEPD